LSSQYFGNVPQNGLDPVLPLSADGYSSWRQAEPGQCGLKPALQAHHSGDGSAAEGSQTSPGWSALIFLGASCGCLLAVPRCWNSREQALQHSPPQ